MQICAQPYNATIEDGRGGEIEMNVYCTHKIDKGVPGKEQKLLIECK